MTQEQMENAPPIAGFNNTSPGPGPDPGTGSSGNPALMPGSPGLAAHAGYSGPEKITLKRNGLTIDCFFGEGGKLRSKVERWGGQSVAYDYVYDEKWTPKFGQV